MLGLERVLDEERPRLASSTELRRHQVDALAGMLTELIHANQKENGNGNGAVVALDEATEALEEEPEDELGLLEDESRTPRTTSTAAPTRERRDGSGSATRRRPARRSRRPGSSRLLAPRRPDPHAPSAARAAVQPRPHHRGVRRAVHRRDSAWADTAAREPDHDPDVRLVRSPRRRDLARRVPPRDRRRGAHRSRREDVQGDPLVPRAALHRHDRDRAADREAGLRRLPGLRRRSAARRSGASRPDRPAPLAPRSAGRRDQQRADRRRRLRPGRSWPRPSTIRR